MPVQIRKATLKDLPDITTCAAKAYAMYINRMQKEPAPMHADFAGQIQNGFVYLATTNDHFAGYVVYYRQGDNHLHLENLAVLPSMHGQGIGKALVKHVEDSARQARLAAVELYTNEAMTENLAMYPKLGYVEVGRKQQDGFDRVFFRKELHKLR